MRVFVAAAAAIALGAAGVAYAGDGAPPKGAWRIVMAKPGPWATADELPEQAPLIGKSILFHGDHIDGPPPLACGRASFGFYETPADGLFQGAGLSATDAAKLGLGADKVKSFTLNCTTGVFEFHYADDETLLLGLDNRVWTLTGAPGARVRKSSPEGVTERFLEAHFNGDMEFTKSALATKRSALSKSLAAAIDAYLEKPQDENEAPTINGDPFTDTQDYPTRFAVGSDDPKAAGIFVPVVYADAYSKRHVDFQLKRQRGRWVIDDLRYEDGSTLRELLVE